MVVPAMNARLMSIVGAAILVVLSACDDLGTPPDGEASADVGSPDAGLVSSAASHAPRYGSVTQGSRAVAGITADRVSWDGSAPVVAGRRLPHLIPGGIDGGSGMRYYTNREETGLAAVASRILLQPGTPPRATVIASDPAAFGLWMYRTGDGFVWGTFADGLAASESPATADTYRGTTVGVYADARGEVEFFVARITLEVAGGSVTGMVDEILDTSGERVTNPLGRGAPGAAPTIVLKAAAATGEPRGDTALAIDGEEQSDWDGKWGVTFFGDAAAGTWGVTDGFTFSVVGAFATR